MNKYTKDNKIIKATGKAYNLLYKVQGYKPYTEIKEKKTNSKTKKEEADI